MEESEGLVSRCISLRAPRACSGDEVASKRGEHLAAYGGEAVQAKVSPPGPEPSQTQWSPTCTPAHAGTGNAGGCGVLETELLAQMGRGGLCSRGLFLGFF